MITGLRGINDPELTSIFKQVEGMNLFNIFIKETFNIFSVDDRSRAINNINRLTDILIIGGINPSDEVILTSSDDLSHVMTPSSASHTSVHSRIIQILRDYVRDYVEELGIVNQLDACMDIADPVIEMIADNFEDYLKPALIDRFSLDRDRDYSSTSSEKIG